MVNAQSCPDDNHPHVIDLGLPSGTKWACCNVGATIPEGYGSYYAWGETEEKETYDWASYIHSDGSMETCHDIGLDIAKSEYDVAHVRWGGSWIMPSQDQFQELVTQCQYTWTAKNDVSGHMFTGPSGGSIFLPNADFWRISSLDNTVDELPSAGYYWSSTLNPSNPSVASYLLVSNSYAYWDSYNYRYSGFTVRPVLSETNSIIHPRVSADASRQAVYNISGIKVANVIGEKKNLPAGFYIVNNRKIILH